MSGAGRASSVNGGRLSVANGGTLRGIAGSPGGEHHGGLRLTGSTVTVNGGTLSIASDANLGAAGGSLALGAGTLRATGTFTTSRTTTLTGGGTFDIGLGTLTHAGAIGGSGGLVKRAPARSS